MGVPPVIDLGLERDIPDPAHGPLGGGRARPRSPAARRWAVAGCLALVLLAVAGATPPARPSLFLVDPQPAGGIGYSVVDDQLLVMARRGPVLSSYHLPDGRLLWSAPITGDNWVGSLGSPGGVVLVLTQTTGEDCCQIAAYDREDGRVRWSRHSEQLDFEVDDDLLAVTVGGSRQVIDMPSGRVLWQSGEPAVVRLAGRHDIMVMHPDGPTERRDLRIGKVEATARTYPPGTLSPASVIVDDQLIVITRRESGRGTVAGYDVDTLAPIWERGLAVDQASRCGPVLCLYAGQRLEAVDPRTGMIRWRRADWYVREQGGRLLATTSGLGVEHAIGVVDPLSGRTLLDLRAWVAHPTYPGASQLVLTRTSADAGRTTVAVVDLTRLTLQVVGVIPNFVADCQAGAASLVCRAGSGRPQLWAYRR